MFATLLSLLLLASPSQVAAPVDSLATARLAYEKTTEDIGRSLLSGLEKADDTAHKEVDRKRAESIEAELTALREQGVWPTSLNTVSSKHAWNVARDGFRRALQSAANEAFKASRSEDDQNLKDDLDAFNITNDLAPWTPLAADPTSQTSSWQIIGGALIGKPGSDAQRSLMHVGKSASPEYALRLRIQRPAGKGGLSVYFPDSSGQTLELSLLNQVIGVGDSGEVQACISVTKNRITLDLDGKRVTRWTPESAPRARPETPNDANSVFGLSVSGDGTEIRVQSIEYKPLFRLEKSQDHPIAASAIESGALTKQPALADLLAPGSVWQGTWDELAGSETFHYPVTMYILSHSGGSVTCKIWLPTVANGAVADWSGQIGEAGDLTINSFTIVYGKAGKGRIGLVDSEGQMIFRNAAKGIDGSGQLTDRSGASHTIKCALRQSN